MVRAGRERSGRDFELQDKIRVEEQQQGRKDPEAEDGGDGGEKPSAQVVNSVQLGDQKMRRQSGAKKTHETRKKTAGAGELEVFAAMGAIEGVGMGKRRS